MLNISKQIHVGWDTNKIVPAEQVLHEAGIMPDGTSSNELKKFTKFMQTHPTVITIDNVPMPGFTLYDVSRNRWSTADSTWMVIDPRGFITRITNNNLANILRVTGITEGLIQQKCVWAREDSNTVLTLVPISSKDYATAVDNTEILDSKVSIKDVNIGDTVLLQNGLQGKYMGVLSLYCDIEKNFKVTLKSVAMLRKQIVEILPGKFYYNTDAKILKVVSKAATPMTRDESANYINNCIETNPNFYFSQGTKFTTGPQIDYKRIRLVSVNAETKVKIKLEEISKSEAESLFYSAMPTRNQGMLLLEYPAGNKCLVDFPWWGNTSPIDTTSFSVDDIKEISENEINLIDVRNGSNYSYYASVSKPKKSLDNFAKFYKIIKCVRSLTFV